MTAIEIWLTKRNIEVTCRIVREDESTEKWLIGSLSMRGAQREITKDLKSLGYLPKGRWAIEAGDANGVIETSRRFKK